MKTNKIPSSVILLISSWLAVSAGVIVTISFVIFNYPKIGYFQYVIFILGCLFIAVTLRMLANVGQLIFDLSATLHKINNILNDSLNLEPDRVNGNPNNFGKGVCDRIDSIHKEVCAKLDSQGNAALNGSKSIVNNLNVLSGDLKKVDKSISDIRDFFEKIEEHLDLKK